MSPPPAAGNGFFSLRKLDNFPGLIFNYRVNTVKGKRKFQTRQQLSGKTRERSRVVPVGGILPTELEMKKKLVVEVFSTLL